MLRENLYRVSSLSCLSRLPVSTLHAQVKAVRPLDLLLRTTAGQQQLLELTSKRAMAIFSLCLNVESTTRLLIGMAKNRPCLSLCSSLGGLLSRPHNVWHENASLWPGPLCTQHYNSDNCEPSDLVAECIFCALW